MVRMPDRPTCSARIQTEKVSANCRMIELGASVTSRVRRKRHERQERADEDAAEDGEEEGRRDLGERKAAGSHRADRQPVDQQRAGIVEQALALEHGEHTVRQAELARHGGGGGRIGRRDDGAERDRGSQRDIRHDHPDRDRDQHRGDADGRDGEPGDGEPNWP